MKMKKTIVVAVCVLFISVVSNAALVAHWEFDESSGSLVLSDSAGITDGSVGDGVDFVISGAGVLGSGLGNAGDFSTTANYVTLGSPDILDLGTGNFTMTGWFRSPDVTLETYYHMIIENGQHSVGGVNLWLARGDRSYRGKFGLDVKGSDVNVTVMSDSRLDDNNWHWFAAIVNSGTARVYIDGVYQAASGTYGAATTATAPEGFTATIGKNFNGLLDDLRVYDIALTGTLDENNTLISGDLYDVWRVPEPATLALLAGGFVMLARKR